MKILVTVSNLLIPLIIFYVVINGLIRKKEVYSAFTRGAMDGLKTVAKILPTLIGLMMAVGILRASGFLDFFAAFLAPVFGVVKIPGEAVPVLVVKMFSSSAATGLVLDLFQKFGPDSYIGTLVSLSMSCSETIFYTMSVYFVTVKVGKTRYTLAGALISTAVGLAASVVFALMMQ